MTDPPFEAGASQRDSDYLHLLNWKTAEQVVSTGISLLVSAFTRQTFRQIEQLEGNMAAYMISKSYSMSGWRVGYAVSSVPKLTS